MNLKKNIYISIGSASLGLGIIGIFIPILPTVPFFLLTLGCFAKSSERLHRWFMGTEMYKKHLESFVERKGMTMQTKIGILASVTILMGIGFVMMNKTVYGRIILGIVWALHVAYFLFGVKTISCEEATK